MSLTKPPRLNHAQLERLAWLSEELGEAQQAIGKILRHGYASKHPHVVDSVDNRMYLVQELGDVLAAVMLLVRNYDLDVVLIAKRAMLKLKNVKQYMHHQADL